MDYNSLYANWDQQAMFAEPKEEKQTQPNDVVQFWTGHEMLSCRVLPRRSSSSDKSIIPPIIEKLHQTRLQYTQKERDAIARKLMITPNMAYMVETNKSNRFYRHGLSLENQEKAKNQKQADELATFLCKKPAINHVPRPVRLRYAYPHRTVRPTTRRDVQEMKRH